MTRFQTIRFVTPVVDPASPSNFERKDFGPLKTPSVRIESDGLVVTLTAPSGRQTIVSGIGYDGQPFTVADVRAEVQSMELDEPLTSVEKFKSLPPGPFTDFAAKAQAAVDQAAADKVDDWDTQPGIIRHGSVGQVHPRERVKPVVKTRKKGDV